jgi:hypothetical protein
MLTPIQVAVLITLVAALLSVGYSLNVLPRDERRNRHRDGAHGEKEGEKERDEEETIIYIHR